MEEQEEPLLLRKRVAGALFGVGFLSGCFLGCCILGPCALVLLPLGLIDKRFIKAYRWCARRVASTVFTFAAAMLEVLGGVDCSCVGGADDKSVILVANHVSRVDWMFVWCLAARHAAAGRVVIAAKSDLKKLPLLGWLMQGLLHVFVSRVDRATDLGALEHRFAAHQQGTWALVFPEGTDLSESNVVKSRAFGAKMVPPRLYSRVLVPRAAGTAAVIRGLSGFDAIYDLTISYSGARPSEPRLCSGRFPTRARLRVDRFAFEDLPPAVRDGDEAAVAEFIFQRWDAKEQRLLLDDDKEEGAPAPMLTYVSLLVVVYAAAAASCVVLYRSGGSRLVVLVGCAAWHFGTRVFGGVDDIVTRLENSKKHD